MERNPPRPGASYASSGLDLALSRIGFDPATGTGTRPSAAPMPAPRPAPDGRAAVDLARRDWLLGTMERQRRLSPLAGGLVRCEGMERQEFLDHFYAPGRPCVVTGALGHWPALGRWTPAYLREKVGDAPVEFQSGRRRTREFELDKAKLRKVLPFTDFLDRILASPGNDAYVTANNSDNAGNRAAFAPLMADTGPIPFALGPGEGMIWIGPEGTFTPLHFDLTNNLLVQVTGSKRILLVPPSETRYLYHRRHVFSDIHDLEDPARLRIHPLAKQAQTFEVTLGPGEILYIPIGWWHQVRSLEFSVMLTCTNFLWPNLGYGDYPGDAA